MRQNQMESNESGISISVSIPAKNPKIYSREATDELLAFLTRNRFDQFTQRELERQTGYSESGIRRAVEILEENNLVLSEYDANKKLIEINRSRLNISDDPILRIPQDEFQKPVREAKKKIKNELESVVGIILHGSVARGEADRRSDIDLWVIVNENRAENQREANVLENDLEDRKFENQRYDFHITVESVDAVPAFEDEIQEIVLSGIPIYKTDSFEKLRNILAHGGINE